MTEQYAPKYNEDFPNQDFPLSSEAAHAAYRYFWSHTHQNDQHPEMSQADQERMSISNTILGSFCGSGDKAVYDETYEAAILSDLADKTDSNSVDGGRNAKRALKKYFVDFEHEQYNILLSGGEDERSARQKASHKAQYVAGLLSDRDKIHQFWNQQSSSESPAETGPRLEWDSLSNLVNLDKMLDLAKTVNIESILIMAAQLTSYLTKQADALDLVDGDDTLDKIQMSESLIAPLLEIMGYDGFAMNLNSVTKRIRLKNLGENGHMALLVANKIIAAHNEKRVSDGVRDIMSSLVGDTDKEAVFEFNRDARILMEHGYCQPYGLDESSYFIVRRKTRGSMAWKLYQDYIKKDSKINGLDKKIGEFPLAMDVIAAQIIFDDNQSESAKNNKNEAEEDKDDSSNAIEIDNLANTFATIVGKAVNDDKITLSPSPSRDSAVHIRGTKDFRSRVARAVYGQGYSGDFEARDEQPGDMEVAKLTFYYHDNAMNGNDMDNIPLSFEIQLLTERQRNAMRTDKIAHIFYKLGISNPTAEQIAYLKEINRRKDSIKESYLVNPAAAKDYMDLISRVDSYGIGSISVGILQQ